MQYEKKVSPSAQFLFLNQILIFLTQKFQLEVPYNSTQSEFS